MVDKSFVSWIVSATEAIVDADVKETGVVGVLCLKAGVCLKAMLSFEICCVKCKRLYVI